MNKHKRILSLLCGLALSANMQVNADEELLKIQGFATAGFVTGDLETDFFSGTDIIGESATFGADNTIGLQIVADMNDQITFTGQLLAKGTIDAYNLEAHWAFVDYHPRHDFSLRAGRLVLPIMMGSEYIDVGYAYPWIRPPMEVYSGIPLTSYSGIDVLYTHKIGSMNLIFQPYVGSLPLTTTVNFEMEAELGIGLNTTLQFEYGAIRLHAMRVSDAAGNDGNTGLAFDMNSDVIAIGADLEFANIVLVSEYMKKEFELSGIPGYDELGGEAWYMTLGYRMGKFLPHITISMGDTDTDQMPALDAFIADLMSNLDFNNYFESLTPPDQAAFEADPIAYLSNPSALAALAGAGVDAASLSAMASSADLLLPPAPFAYKQRSLTIGLRYDFLPQTALKFEYQQIEPQEESWGLFINAPDDKANLFSFAIDVTF